jgi:hypothetical protein
VNTVASVGRSSVLGGSVAIRARHQASGPSAEILLAVRGLLDWWILVANPLSQLDYALAPLYCTGS